MALKITADFTNVKDGGGFNSKRLPSGDYIARISKVEKSKSKAGNDQLVFTITPDDHRSAAYPYYCGLEEKQLWKLRNLLLAAGVKVPKKKASIDVERLVGVAIGIALEDDEYEGKERSTIDSIFPANEVEGAEDEKGTEDEEDGEDTESTDEDDLDELDL